MSYTIEDLKSKLKIVVTTSAEATAKFFEDLSTDLEERGTSKEKRTILEFALRMMEHFTEDQGYWVASGCQGLISKCDDGTSLMRVKKIREKLPALPGLRDYRLDYDE